MPTPGHFFSFEYFFILPFYSSYGNLMTWMLIFLLCPHMSLTLLFFLKSIFCYSYWVVSVILSSSSLMLSSNSLMLFLSFLMLSPSEFFQLLCFSVLQFPFCSFSWWDFVSTSSIFIIACWNIFMVLQSLSDNAYISIISVGICDCPFSFNLWSS